MQIQTCETWQYRRYNQEKIKQDENKLDEIDKSIENIEKQELEILGKLEAYEGQVEKKFAEFETKLIQLWKSIEEKDEKIANLELSVK